MVARPRSHDDPADQAAEAYDRWFETRWGRYAFGVEQGALEEALGPLGHKRLLDAGCGTGRFTTVLEARAEWVVGLDLDAAMLRVCSERVSGPLLSADVLRLPFSDGAFDLAVAVTLCEFAAEPALVVSELVRVTRPGGRVVIGALNPRSPWGLASRRRFRRSPWRQARFLDRRQLLALGEAHGRASMAGSLYAPATAVRRTFSRLLEGAGRRFVPGLGAFQVLTIDRA